MTTSTLSVTMLGAGQEVGRSCCVLKYKGITVVCDAGIHPAHSGIASLPFIDVLDWSTVDAILITHFHLDHAAALTYIMEKTNFGDGRGKVYMTHPTKAVYRLIMQDFDRMSETPSGPLFTPKDLANSLSNIIPISAHQLISPSPRLSFTPYHAGHVIGACMYMVEIDDLKILYTGDYSREETRHLPKAEVPSVQPDVLIIESTHGVQNHRRRDQKEEIFTELVHQIIERGGHVLLPVFALGQPQELMLVLDAYWKAHPELHSIPIYYTSDTVDQSLAVYKAYIHTLNSDMRRRFARQDNPFNFRYVTHLSQDRKFAQGVADGPPCVILATPAMLQSGFSRELLEMWAPDPRNGLIITGYSAEGTLARDIIQNQPNELTSLRGESIPCRLSIHEIAFSAHVDFGENVAFIEQVHASHVVLVHGERHGMHRLKDTLQNRFNSQGKNVEIHTPRNLEPVLLEFKKRQNLTKVIGKLASDGPRDNATLSGLLVSKEFSSLLFDPSEDLIRGDFEISPATIVQRQKLSIGVEWPLIIQLLENMFGPVETLAGKNGNLVFRVMKTLTVEETGVFELTLEWTSSPRNDIVADAVIAFLLNIQGNPLSLKELSMTEHRTHATTTTRNFVETDLERVKTILQAHFGKVEVYCQDENQGTLGLPVTFKVAVDAAEADIYVGSGSLAVVCTDNILQKRLNEILGLVMISLKNFQDVSVRPVM